MVDVHGLAMSESGNPAFSERGIDRPFGRRTSGRSSLGGGNCAAYHECYSTIYAYVDDAFDTSSACDGPAGEETNNACDAQYTAVVCIDASGAAIQAADQVGACNNSSDANQPADGCRLHGFTLFYSAFDEDENGTCSVR